MFQAFFFLKNSDSILYLNIFAFILTQLAEPHLFLHIFAVWSASNGNTLDLPNQYLCFFPLELFMDILLMDGISFAFGLIADDLPNLLQADLRQEFIFPFFIC